MRPDAGKPRGILKNASEGGNCMSTVAMDRLIRQRRSVDSVDSEHERQRKLEAFWLAATLKELSHERRRYTSKSRWHRRLCELDDGDRDIPAWLYHHPEDIADETVGRKKRRRKNPWVKPRPDEKVEFDCDIFSRDCRSGSTQERSESPRGQRTVDTSDPPLPWGASSWDEVQGKPSKQSKVKQITKPIKCLVSRLAYTSSALPIRDEVGALIDCRGWKWPKRLRFGKARSQWTCQ